MAEARSNLSIMKPELEVLCCPYSLEPFSEEPGNRPMLIVSCGHMVSDGSLKQIGGKCPICRGSVGNPVQIYGLTELNTTVNALIQRNAANEKKVEDSDGLRKKIEIQRELYQQAVMQHVAELSRLRKEFEESKKQQSGLETSVHMLTQMNEDLKQQNTISSNLLNQYVSYASNHQQAYLQVQRENAQLRQQINNLTHQLANAKIDVVSEVTPTSIPSEEGKRPVQSTGSLRGLHLHGGVGAGPGAATPKSADEQPELNSNTWGSSPEQ